MASVLNARAIPGMNETRIDASSPEQVQNVFFSPLRITRHSAWISETSKRDIQIRRFFFREDLSLGTSFSKN